MIPLKTKKINYFEDLNSLNFEKDIDNSSIKGKRKLFFSERESNYKNKLKYNIKTLNISKHNIKRKIFNLDYIQNRNKKERYNSLFGDFFYKWTNNTRDLELDENCKTSDYNNKNCIGHSNKKINNIEYIKNEKYSELKYDDNKIFNQDYSNFVKEKIDYIKDNTIENTQVRLESNFDDLNGKEIKLKLESIKIHFKPIKDGNKLSNINVEEEDNKSKDNPSKDIILFIPLYYAFLFCYKNLDFFKHILISTITFYNNFEKIDFDGKLISSSLTAIDLKDHQETGIKRRVSCNLKNQTISAKIDRQLQPKKALPFRKLVTNNYTSFTKTLKNSHINERKKAEAININTFSNLKNNILENNQIQKKKEDIIHSNRNKNSNSLYNIHFLSEKNTKIDEEKNKNNNYNYNEYIFLWETCSKTFLVNVQMPMIYFKYKSIKKDIMAFCDKNLFLYIYKNNFINWDFYVLNFLFSIKTFRKIILNNYSLSKNFLLNDISSKTIYNESKPKIIKNNIKSRNNKKSNIKENNTCIEAKQKKYNFFDEYIIINKNHNKVYNILNENKESYLFFYTDNSYNNSIIKFYSYIISIDYDKLNPKIKWKYFLDFKKMKKLNEISKYESLDLFLPKIVKTDFQNGLLSMDFSLFDEFNIETLEYEKKNIINSNKLKNKTVGLNNTQIKDELCIEILYPFIQVEKVLKEKIKIEEDMSINNISFFKNKIKLDINFLQKINNYRIDSWSKIILGIINNNDNNNSNISSDLIGENIPFRKRKGLKMGTYLQKK